MEPMLNMAEAIARLGALAGSPVVVALLLLHIARHGTAPVPRETE